MAKINTQKQFLTIPHPQMSEFKVHCNIFEPVEAMDTFSELAKYQKIVAIIHPVTGDLIRNSEGIIETITVSNIPPEAILNILKNTIDDWEGLEDENGKSIKYEPSKLPYLFKKELSVLKKDGTREAFAVYIQGELNSKIDLSNPPEESIKKLPKQR